MENSETKTSWFGKAMTAGIAVVSIGAATLATVEPAAAQFRGGFHGGGFGGSYYRPHFGGGFRGGYGGFRGGYGGYRHGGYGRGVGFGLAGLGVGLALGSGAYYGGYGYPGYYGTGYGYGGYNGCLRRVYGPYGPHLVNVCY